MTRKGSCPKAGSSRVCCSWLSSSCFALVVRLRFSRATSLIRPSASTSSTCKHEGRMMSQKRSSFGRGGTPRSCGLHHYPSSCSRSTDSQHAGNGMSCTWKSQGTTDVQHLRNRGNSTSGSASLRSSSSSASSSSLSPSLLVWCSGPLMALCSSLALARLCLLCTVLHRGLHVMLQQWY